MPSWCLVSAPVLREESDGSSVKEEVNAFLCALRQLLSSEWRGTVAQPRKKSMPSWCLVSAPVLREERDSSSVKEEVNAFLGALYQHLFSERRETVAQPRKKSMPSLVPCISTCPQRGERR